MVFWQERIKNLANMPITGVVSAMLGLTSLVGVANAFVADLSILAFAGTPVGNVVSFNGRKYHCQHPIIRSAVFS